jgi:hypothetical protein
MRRHAPSLFSGGGLPEMESRAVKGCKKIVKKFSLGLVAALTELVLSPPFRARISPNQPLLEAQAIHQTSSPVIGGARQAHPWGVYAR